MKAKKKKFVDSKGEELIAIYGALEWSGCYSPDNMLGWLAPKFPSDFPTGLSEEQKECMADGNNKYYPGDMYRVKISLEPVLDKQVRFIVKRNPKDRK